MLLSLTSWFRRLSTHFSVAFGEGVLPARLSSLHWFHFVGSPRTALALTQPTPSDFPLKSQPVYWLQPLRGKDVHICIQAHSPQGFCSPPSTCNPERWRKLIFALSCILSACRHFWQWAPEPTELFLLATYVPCLLPLLYFYSLMSFSPLCSAHCNNLPRVTEDQDSIRWEDSSPTQVWGWGEVEK